MKLSELNPTPLYDVTIPSTKKKVKFRPFFVREERALLAAYESEDASVMLNTLMMVVKNCITPEQQELTPFDVEYLFLQVRAKSVGEISTLNFTGKKCAKVTPMNIDLRSAEIVGMGSNMNLTLSENLTIKMKYPSVNDLMKIESETDEHKVAMMVISASIDTIFFDSESINVKEESENDLFAFIERLSSKQYNTLENFIKNIPTVQMDIKWNCPHCSEKNENVLKGLNSFF